MALNIASFKSHFRELQSNLPYLPQACVLVWTAARSWTIAWGILLLIQGLLPVVTVYVTRALVNSLVSVWGQGGTWDTLTPLFQLVALMAGVLLLTEVLRSTSGWIRTAQAELVQDYISSRIHSIAGTLDLSFYDTPDFYDRLHRARVDASTRPIALVENMGEILQNGLTLIAMACVLLPFGWWIPIVLAVSTLPAFAEVLRHTVRQHEWRHRTTPDQRRIKYYDLLLTIREAAMEMRLFGLAKHFQTEYQVLRKRLRSERLHLAKSQAMAQLLAGALALFTTGLIMGWMLWRAVQGHISAGDLALFYQAFSQGQGLMRTVLTGVGQIYNNIAFLENLFTFLALKPQIAESTQPLETPTHLKKGITFDQVTFRYPGSDRAALENFSLTIPVGQMIALVGTNGAGKSTLIKLLCRFYDPDSGSITHDGIDIRDMSLETLRRQTTVLFQQPMQYHLSASDNISMGDIAGNPDKQEIIAAAQAAGADAPIARLPNEYETVLGKWFGGAELSVGEWQRIALARAFLRNAPILILDEPTSAMDSWAEAAWVKRFRRLAIGRTVIMVTHRFTTAMHADIIHVMNAGQIVESGSHQKLLDSGGRYADSWMTQMQVGAHPENAAPISNM